MFLKNNILPKIIVSLQVLTFLFYLALFFMKKIILTSLLFTSLVQAQNPGNYDVTFDTDGKLYSQNALPVSGMKKSFIQSNTIYSFYNQFDATNNVERGLYLLKSNMDGSVITNIDLEPDFLLRPQEVIQLASGKFLVASLVIFTDPNTTNHREYPDIRRFNSDGTLDVTFGLNGKVGFPQSYHPQNKPGTCDIAIDATGKIYIAYQTESSTFAGRSRIKIEKYTANGATDNFSFTVGSGDENFDIQDLLIDNTNKILVAAVNGASPSDAVKPYRNTLYKFTSTGSYDVTFDTDGKLAFADGVPTDTYGNKLPMNLVQDNTNRLLATLSVYNPTTISAAYPAPISFLKRMDNNGVEISKTFTGKIVLNDIKIDAANNAVLTGYINNAVASDSNYTQDGYTMRVTDGFTFDNTFDSDGKKTISFGQNSYFIQLAHVLIQPVDQKLLYTGMSSDIYDNLVLVRLHAGISVGIDNAYYTSTKSTAYPNPTTTNEISIQAGFVITAATDLHITDLKGNTIAINSYVENDVLKINTTNLATGIYTYTILQGKEYTQGKFQVIK